MENTKRRMLWRNIIIGKLKEKKVASLDWPEVQQAFSGCVQGNRLAHTAMIMINTGEITDEDFFEHCPEQSDAEMYQDLEDGESF